jgi:hypothetical protein
MHFVGSVHLETGGLPVNHIPLDGQEEAVKRFVLSLPTDANGSILELDGRAIVCVPPASAVLDASAANAPWTEEKNARRCELIDREIDGTLTAPESVELKRLQAEMLRYRQRVAPLPLEDARKLHQELLARAAQAGQF